MKYSSIQNSLKTGFTLDESNLHRQLQNTDLLNASRQFIEQKAEESARGTTAGDGIQEIRNNYESTKVAMSSVKMVGSIAGMGAGYFNNLAIAHKNDVSIGEGAGKVVSIFSPEKGAKFGAAISISSHEKRYNDYIRSVIKSNATGSLTQSEIKTYIGKVTGKNTDKMASYKLDSLRRQVKKVSPAEAKVIRYASRQNKRANFKYQHGIKKVSKSFSSSVKSSASSLNSTFQKGNDTSAESLRIYSTTSKSAKGTLKVASASIKGVYKTGLNIGTGAYKGVANGIDRAKLLHNRYSKKGTSTKNLELLNKISNRNESVKNFKSVASAPIKTASNAIGGTVKGTAKRTAKGAALKLANSKLGKGISGTAKKAVGKFVTKFPKTSKVLKIGGKTIGGAFSIYGKVADFVRLLKDPIQLVKKFFVSLVSGLVIGIGGIVVIIIAFIALVFNLNSLITDKYSYAAYLAAQDTPPQKTVYHLNHIQEKVCYSLLEADAYATEFDVANNNCVFCKASTGERKSNSPVKNGLEDWIIMPSNWNMFDIDDSGDLIPSDNFNKIFDGSWDNEIKEMVASDEWGGDLVFKVSNKTKEEKFQDYKGQTVFLGYNIWRYWGPEMPFSADVAVKTGPGWDDPTTPEVEDYYGKDYGNMEYKTMTIKDGGAGYSGSIGAYDGDYSTDFITLMDDDIKTAQKAERNKTGSRYIIKFVYKGSKTNDFQKEITVGSIENIGGNEKIFITPEGNQRTYSNEVLMQAIISAFTGMTFGYDEPVEFMEGWCEDIFWNILEHSEVKIVPKISRSAHTEVTWSYTDNETGKTTECSDKGYDYYTQVTITFNMCGLEDVINLDAYNYAQKNEYRWDDERVHKAYLGLGNSGEFMRDYDEKTEDSSEDDYTDEELKEMGLTDEEIKEVRETQKVETKEETEEKESDSKEKTNPSYVGRFHLQDKALELYQEWKGWDDRSDVDPKRYNGYYNNEIDMACEIFEKDSEEFYIYFNGIVIPKTIAPIISERCMTNTLDLLTEVYGLDLNNVEDKKRYDLIKSFYESIGHYTYASGAGHDEGKYPEDYYGQAIDMSGLLSIILSAPGTNTEYKAMTCKDLASNYKKDTAWSWGYKDLHNLTVGSVLIKNDHDTDEQVKPNDAVLFLGYYDNGDGNGYAPHFGVCRETWNGNNGANYSGPQDVVLKEEEYSQYMYAIDPTKPLKK